MGNTIRAIIISTAIALSACGKTEKVEGIKGPRGDKGERGETGDSGQPTVIYTPMPQPTVTVTANPYPTPTPVITSLPPTIPYPPIIIVGQPWPDCNSGGDIRCRSGNILVCACIDTYWKTISVNVHYRDRLRIKHDGPCYTQALTSMDYWSDCWGKPKPVPQPPQPQNNRC